MAAIDKSLYEKFELESVDGSKSADISAGVVSFNYYEDVYSPMITAMVVVVNTGNVIEGDDGKLQSLYNGFPLRGGERVDMKIVNGSCPNLEFTQKTLNELYVASITNVIVEAEREVFTLNCVSREALANNIEIGSITSSFFSTTPTPVESSGTSIL